MLARPGGPSPGCTVAGRPLSWAHSCLSSLVREDCRAALLGRAGRCLLRGPPTPSSVPPGPCLRPSRPPLFSLVRMKVWAGQPEARKCRNTTESRGPLALPFADRDFSQQVDIFGKSLSVSPYLPMSLLPLLILCFQSYLHACFGVVVIIHT